MLQNVVSLYFSFYRDQDLASVFSFPCLPGKRTCSGSGACLCVCVSVGVCSQISDTGWLKVQSIKHDTALIGQSYKSPTLVG